MRRACGPARARLSPGRPRAGQDPCEPPGRPVSWGAGTLVIGGCACGRRGHTAVVSLGPCSDVRIISSAARDSCMAWRTPTLGLEKLMGVNSAVGRDKGEVGSSLSRTCPQHCGLCCCPTPSSSQLPDETLTFPFSCQTLVLPGVLVAAADGAQLPLRPQPQTPYARRLMPCGCAEGRGQRVAVFP